MLLMKMLNSAGPSTNTPGNAICPWSSFWHQAIDHNSFSETMQTILYALTGPPINLMSLHFRDKNVMQDSVKYLAQVQVEDISCSSPIHHHCKPATEDSQIC